MIPEDGLCMHEQGYSAPLDVCVLFCIYIPLQTGRRPMAAAEATVVAVYITHFLPAAQPGWVYIGLRSFTAPAAPHCSGHPSVKLSSRRHISKLGAALIGSCISRGRITVAGFPSLNLSPISCCRTELKLPSHYGRTAGRQIEKTLEKSRPY